LSRMTSGPLTPPMVLYFNRGLIEVIRGSRSAEGAMAEGLRSRLGGGDREESARERQQ
jgi:hypothetical protein